jgi:hypothetical protein
MIYVASPYSSPLPEIVRYRYEKACLFTDRLIAKGEPAFSPIAYCHPIAMRTRMTTDASTWMAFNMSFLRKADALYLLRLSGWDKSKGVEVEMNVAKMLGIPIVEWNENFRVVQ